MNKIKEWINDNNESILAIAVPALFGALTTIYKIITNGNNKTKRIYDPRLGFYWELRRGISNNERRIIEQKRKNGQALGDILAEMKLLKGL